MGDDSMSNASKRVYVFRKGCGYVVRPAAIDVEAGETVYWVNYTERPLELLLGGSRAARMPFDAASQKQVAHRQRNGVERTDLVVTIDAEAAPGAYEYALFSEAAKGLVEGESSPVIIIRD
jgi:plastocyanin